MKKTKIPKTVDAILRQNDTKDILASIEEKADQIEAMFVIVEMANGTYRTIYAIPLAHALGLVDIARNDLLGQSETTGELL